MKSNEKGSVTLVVLVTILFIIILLSSFLVYTNERRRAQLKETDKISNSYDGDMAEIYNSLPKESTVALKSRMRVAPNGQNNNSKLQEITGNETENTETVDILGNKIVIPAGFKVINPNDTVQDGIVIEDVNAGDTVSKGNQYVWIPVGEINTKIEDTKKIDLKRYEFNKDGEIINDINSIANYEEYSIKNVNPYKNATSRNIEEFINSTNYYGGYYLSRYKAGDYTANSSRTSESNQIALPVFKENKIIYNWTTQSNAVALTQKLYTNQSTSYKSDLINSYAFDTALVFIQAFSGDEKFSGQTTNSELKLTSKGTDSTAKSDVRCNIYDMLNGLYEYTTETNKDEILPVICRGNTYLAYREKCKNNDTKSGNIRF